MKKMETKKLLHMIAYLLVIVGALNWGLVGFFDINLVTMLGLPSGLVKTVYGLIGVAAVYDALLHPALCKLCSGSKK